MEIIIEPLVTEKQTALFDALIENGYFATEKAARVISERHIGFHFFPPKS